MISSPGVVAMINSLLKINLHTAQLTCYHDRHSDNFTQFFQIDMQQLKLISACIMCEGFRYGTKRIQPYLLWIK